MIYIQDIMSELDRFPDIKRSLMGAKYTGGTPLIYRFTGVDKEDPIRLDLTKYVFSVVMGPEEINRKSGSLDMLLYPEEIAYAETGYPCGAKYEHDRLFGILVTKNGTSCDDNTCYDNLDAYMCTLGEGYEPTSEQWFDIANRYLAPDYIPESRANICLMSGMNKYRMMAMKRGYDISMIHRLIKGGAIPLFWFAIDGLSITLYMAESETALENIF